MTRAGKLLRWGIPFVVSSGLLAFLITRIGPRDVWERLTTEAALVLAIALLGYCAFSLWIEALSLWRLTAAFGPGMNIWRWVRVKGATYPMSLVHYGLGGAALSLLVRRLAGIRMGEALGVVFLLGFLDLAILGVVTIIGAALLSTEAPVVRLGVIAAASGAVAAGFVFIRLPMPIPWLARVQTLGVFRAARAASAPLLLELGALRLLFVFSFIALGWAALAAFDVFVPTGDLVVNVAAIALVAALPIAVSGLGTGQVAFVYLFRKWGDPETLLAASLSLSAGLIALRAGIGLAFAREFSRGLGTRIEGT